MELAVRLQSGERTAGYTFRRVVGREETLIWIVRIRKFCHDDARLDSRAVDNEHEQESGNDPDNRGCRLKGEFCCGAFWLAFQPGATFRVAMLDPLANVSTRVLAVPTSLICAGAVLSRLGCNLSPLGFLSRNS